MQQRLIFLNATNKLQANILGKLMYKEQTRKRSFVNEKEKLFFKLIFTLSFIPQGAVIQDLTNPITLKNKINV